MKRAVIVLLVVVSITIGIMITTFSFIASEIKTDKFTITYNPFRERYEDNLGQGMCVDSALVLDYG